MYIEGKLSIGMVIMRVITRRDPAALVAFCRQQNYGLTTVDAHGTENPVKILFMIIRRRDIETVRQAVKRYNPTAFYTIEDIRYAAEGIFPPREEWYQRHYLDVFRLRRKGK